MIIVWLFAVIAILLLAWLILARQRLRQDKRLLDERHKSLRARRATLVEELRKALPKQAKLPEEPSSADLQTVFATLDKATTTKIRLLREELVALDEKISAHPKPR